MTEYDKLNIQISDQSIATIAALPAERKSGQMKQVGHIE